MKSGYFCNYNCIFFFETDKTAAEIPSTVNGTLTEITAPEGETVPVGGKIATVE